MDDAPPPVPGFEHLRWAGPPVSIPLVPRHNHMAQLVARGDDAGIVLAVQIAGQPGEHLASITLDGAFGSWPPRVDEVVVHREVQLWNRPPRLAARSRDEVLVWSGEPFTFTWGRPGSKPFPVASPEASAASTVTGGGFHFDPAVLLVGEDPDHVFEVARPVEGGLRVVRRGERGGRPATALDVLPVASSRVVTRRGAILGVQQHLPPARPKKSKRAAAMAPLPTRIETSVFPGVEGSGATFELPLGAGVADLVADQDGGAWLACWSRDGAIVYHLDAKGHVVGEPRRSPFGTNPSTAIASWRDGFVLYVHHRAIALVASDGAHFTRVEGAPGGEGDVTGDLHSLLVSPDERSILLCHLTTKGIQLMRGDLSPAAPGETLPDVWAEDRLARAKVVAQRAVVAATPPPLPGRRMETTSDGSVPPHLHTKERIVRQVRICHLLVALSMLGFGDETRFDGDERAGSFTRHDGSGGMDCFVWSAAGLVGSSYDHDLGGPMGEDATAENAPMCFPDLPDALRPLLDQLIEATGGNVSGGLWVTSGEDARWSEEGSFQDAFAFYSKTPEASLRRRGRPPTEIEEAHARLAIALAEKSAVKHHVLTEEEVCVVLESPAARDPRHVGHLVRALGALNIEWRDAKARVTRRAEARKVDALESLGALQIDLLRATARGDVAAVAAAIDAGADLECRARGGVLGEAQNEVRRVGPMTGPASPLVVATVLGHEEVIDLLLARGAKPEGVPPTPDRPPLLVAALLVRRNDLFCRLARQIAGFDADSLLHTHIHQGRTTTIEVVRLLLERGANPRTGAEREGVLSAAEAAGDEELAARYRGPPV